MAVPGVPARELAPAEVAATPKRTFFDRLAQGRFSFVMNWLWMSRDDWQEATRRHPTEFFWPRWRWINFLRRLAIGISTRGRFESSLSDQEFEYRRQRYLGAGGTMAGWRNIVADVYEL